MARTDVPKQSCSCRLIAVLMFRQLELGQQRCLCSCPHSTPSLLSLCPAYTKVDMQPRLPQLCTRATLLTWERVSLLRQNQPWKLHETIRAFQMLSRSTSSYKSWRIRRRKWNLFQLLKSSWSICHMTPCSLCTLALKRNVQAHQWTGKDEEGGETLYCSWPDWLGGTWSICANPTLKCPLPVCSQPRVFPATALPQV